MSSNESPSVDEFLGRPLVARLATNGPTVRPVWFLWEDEAFWWITGAHSKLPDRLSADPEVALVVDSCDLDTGTVLQVGAGGRAEVVAMDTGRARRKLTRYLGDDLATWPEQFRDVLTDPTARLATFTPRRRVRLVDQSFRCPACSIRRSPSNRAPTGTSVRSKRRGSSSGRRTSLR